MEDADCILTIKSTIDGIWVNNNEDSKSTTKVIISNNGKNVQIFDKCSPKHYDRRTNILTPEGYSTNMYWAIFNSDIAKSTFIFTIDNNNMEVRYEQDYKSPSMETKRFIENFTKLDLSIDNSVVTSTYARTKTPPETEVVGTLLPELNNTPILFKDNLFTNYDIENPYEITSVKTEMLPVKAFKSGIFYCSPSTYHLQYNESKNYGLLKWILNVSIFIGNILNRARNTVSIRRLMSLADITT